MPGTVIASSNCMELVDYANELLKKQNDNHRAAFIEAIYARGTDGRTKQFKHYDKIVKWMSANWDKELN